MPPSALLIVQIIGTNIFNKLILSVKCIENSASDLNRSLKKLFAPFFFARLRSYATWRNPLFHSPLLFFSAIRPKTLFSYNFAS